MEIFSTGSIGADRKAINYTANVLKNKGIAVIPTDTLYALSASATDRGCVKRVYEIKGRSYRKPLSVMFSSLPQARRYVKFNRLALAVARRFLPGPLTIILPMRYKFPKELTFGSGNVGVRIPDNGIALGILKRARIPLIATSANLSGGKNPADASTAVGQIGNKVDVVVDGGRCRHGMPSTIVDLSNGELKVIRRGVVSREELEKYFGK